MKKYTEKEKFEKRFQYSLAMAGILIALGYFLYDFIFQQEFNIQQGIYTSNPDYILILKVVSFPLIAVDAMWKLSPHRGLFSKCSLLSPHRGLFHDPM